MPFDQTTRNRLQRFVSDARALLTEEFTRQLQKDFGLDPKSGEVTGLDRLGHLDDARLETARLLRDILAHYLASDMARGQKGHKAALDRILREQAFTVLNRLAALRMMEARGLLRESVGNGYQSTGFKLYERLAGHALGETGAAYRVYLESLFDEFAVDLKVLFDRYSPQGRLFPGETALLKLLDLINDPEIESLWAEDETIGWVYQYFNSKEERKKMRDESAAPRNSRELAVRNQFFTPRYVVEFLVDNTLGRMWFDLTGGQTSLYDRCQYLLVKSGEAVASCQSSVASDKKTLTTDHRPLTTVPRDPRTIKLLDPACGSMHFGLYAFDLFEVIYREAWAWEQEHGPGSLGGDDNLGPLAKTYATEEAFLLDVPRLIIERNIYGVEIDPRAAQIASLALWLRAQRAWNDAGVKAQDRPLIGRSNVIAAVAPPTEKDLRERFASGLDAADAELFERSLVMLKGLPELGVLLRIERELPDLIRQVYGEHGPMFREQDAAQWQAAESRLREALEDFVHAARSGYQGRLFAQDALEGLRLMDLTREQFDVVVMNPPFGEPSEFSRTYCDKNFVHYNKNLLCAFFIRFFDLLRDRGLLGVIFDRTAIVKNTYENFRREFLLCDSRLTALADLGWGVLDANVEVASLVLNKGATEESVAKFGDVRTVDVAQKGERLLKKVSGYKEATTHEDITEYQPQTFLKMPNAVLGYNFPPFAVRLFRNSESIHETGVQVIAGHTILSERYFRYWWEVPAERSFYPGAAWQRLYNGGEYCRFISHLCDAVYYGERGVLIADNRSTIFRNPDRQGLGVLGFGKRGDFIDAHLLPAGFVSSVEGQAVLLHKNLDKFAVLAFFNSRVFQSLINLYCGQHKYPGYVHLLPAPDWDSEAASAASRIAEKAYRLKESFESADETSPLFFMRNTARFWDPSFIGDLYAAKELLNGLEQDMNSAMSKAYGLTEDEKEILRLSIKSEPSTGGVLDANPEIFWARNGSIITWTCLLAESISIH